jgi:preprotein translocase subunit SecD
VRRLPIWWFVAMFVAAAYCVVILAFRDNHPGGVSVELTLDPVEELETGATVRDVLERALPAIRERVSEKGVDTSVFIERDKVVVEIVGDRQIAAEVAKLLVRRAKLEMKVVADCEPPCSAQGEHNGSRYMQRLHQKVRGDPAAAAAGITTDIDSWRPEDGGSQHTDFYLRAADREETVTPDEAKRIGCPFSDRPCMVTGKRVIERYVADLANADPTFKVPDDREIAFERVDPPADAKDRRPFWRSYYLDKRPRLTGAAIAKATPSYDANTNRPIVLLDLTRAGGQMFGDLTAEIVGMKLATVLDGKIKSAPIINGAIRGGRASITMGGVDQARAERDRSDLVAVIGAGAMPPLQELSAREFPELTGVAWPKLVPGLAVLLGLAAFALLRRRAA